MTAKKPFQVKTHKRITRPDVKFIKAKKIKKEPIGPLIVKGMTAGSKEEWRCAQALDLMMIEYQYQVPVYGGRSIRGGQVLDFVLQTPGKWTVLDVRGTYWHTGIREDNLDIQRVIRKKGWLLLTIWDTQCRTVSDALSFLRQNLTHG